MKSRALKLAMVMMLGGFALTSCGGDAKTDANTESHEHTAEYQCPMDCEKGKTYDKEGECPVCHMALKEVEHAH